VPGLAPGVETGLGVVAAAGVEAAPGAGAATGAGVETGPGAAAGLGVELESGCAARDGDAEQQMANDRPKSFADPAFVRPNHAREGLQISVLRNMANAAGIASEENGYLVELRTAYSNRMEMTMVFILSRAA
jgi:hypothetical protein